MSMLGHEKIIPGKNTLNFVLGLLSVLNVFLGTLSFQLIVSLLPVLCFFKPSTILFESFIGLVFGFNHLFQISFHHFSFQPTTGINFF